MVTGDDILIEYVTRILHLFSSKKVREEDLTAKQQDKIEKFITHYVWYSQDKNNGKEVSKNELECLRVRLQNRLNEMLERRRRLLKMLFKKEGHITIFQEQYPGII